MTDKIAKIVFVVGNSRSGTTLMGRILNQHPQVLMFRELHFFEELWNPTRGGPDIDRDDAVHLAATLLSIQRSGYLETRDPASFVAEAQSIVADIEDDELVEPAVFARVLGYEAAKYGADIACDQTPRNVYYLDEILQFFPNAFVVEMVRDPRDVLLSKKRKWQRGALGGDTRPTRAAMLSWANYHPFVTSRLWKSAVRAGNRFVDHPRVMRVKFEQLLDAPELTVRQICDFLELKFHEEMLGVARIGSSSVPDDAETGIRVEAAGRWRQGGLSDSEVYLCEKLAGAEMRELEYQAAQARPNVLVLGAYSLMLPVKILAAALLNVRRFKSFFEAMRRRGLSF